MERIFTPHIVRGFENSQDLKTHIHASPQIKKSKGPKTPKFL